MNNIVKQNTLNAVVFKLQIPHRKVEIPHIENFQYFDWFSMNMADTMDLIGCLFIETFINFIKILGFFLDMDC